MTNSISNSTSRTPSIKNREEIATIKLQAPNSVVDYWTNCAKHLGMNRNAYLISLIEGIQGNGLRFPSSR